MGKHATRYCKNCGVQLPENANRKQIFCSPQCRNKYTNSRYKIGTPRPYLKKRKCVVCGKKFLPVGEDCYVCSPKCYEEAKKRGLIPEKTEKQTEIPSKPECNKPLPCDKIFKSKSAKSKPQPKPEFTINTYYCWQCKKKTRAKVKENAGYCSVCGGLVFSTGAANLANYHSYIKSLATKKKPEMTRNG